MALGIISADTGKMFQQYFQDKCTTIIIKMAVGGEAAKVTANYQVIIGALEANISAATDLRRHLVSVGWIHHTFGSKPEMLVSVVLNRISGNDSEYFKFMDIMGTITGLDQVKASIEKTNESNTDDSTSTEADFRVLKPKHKSLHKGHIPARSKQPLRMPMHTKTSFLPHDEVCETDGGYFSRRSSSNYYDRDKLDYLPQRHLLLKRKSGELEKCRVAVEEHEKKIEDMKSEISKLREEMMKNEKSGQDRQLEKENATLCKENEALKKEIDRLNAQIVKWIEEKSKAERQCTALSNEVVILKAEKNSLRMKITDLTRDMGSLKRRSLKLHKLNTRRLDRIIEYLEKKGDPQVSRLREKLKRNKSDPRKRNRHSY